MPRNAATNGYKMPEPLPQGEILEDVNKKRWKLGPSIGKGGFGEIYSAQDVTDKKSNKYLYVVKIEPHTNGPLFVEMHFLLKNAKKEDIKEFMEKKKLKSLGMPCYLGSGSHTVNDQKYRFVVLEKFGSDIWKLFLENKKEIPAVTVFKIGIQILDVLEYIHSTGYVHHDIKGTNILLDLKSDDQVYLVDFGLACRYFNGNEYKPDPKKAHDGTLEYISRDGHNGLPTRRGDLEILGYNLIQWLGCNLPWEKIKKPQSVQESKESFMNNIPKSISDCFKDKDVPKAVVEYFEYLIELNYDSEPDYKKLRKILTSGVESYGGSVKSPLRFKHSKTPTKRKVGPDETPSSGKKVRLGRRKLDVNSKDKNDGAEENDVEENDGAQEDDDADENDGIEENDEVENSTKSKRRPKVKPVRTTKKTTKDKNSVQESLNNGIEETTGTYTAEMKKIMDNMALQKAQGKKSRKQKVKDVKPSTTKKHRKLDVNKDESEGLEENDGVEENDDVEENDGVEENDSIEENDGMEENEGVEENYGMEENDGIEENDGMEEDEVENSTKSGTKKRPQAKSFKTTKRTIKEKNSAQENLSNGAEESTGEYNAEMKKVTDNKALQKAQRKKSRKQEAENVEPSTSNESSRPRRNRNIVNYAE